MNRRTIHIRLHYALLGAATGFHLIQFFLIPALWSGYGLAPASPRSLAVPAFFALFNNTLWSFLHEAIHFKIHPDRAVNQAMGRALGVLYGSPFRALQVGHLMHHRFSRTELEQAEIFDPRSESWLRARVGFHFRTLGGVYLRELLVPLIVFLPHDRLRKFVELPSNQEGYAGEITRGLFNDRATLSQLRFDTLLIYASLAASAWIHGPAWPLLAAALALRALQVSFMDYAYHYGSPTGDPAHGFNLRLPRAASVFLLNFNYHGVHHRHPSLPWQHLPEAFARDGAAMEGGLASVALRQLRGPRASIGRARVSTVPLPGAAGN